MTRDLTTAGPAGLMLGDYEAALGDYLRLNVAEGDASPHTVRAYYTHARQYAAWCMALGIDPRAAGDGTIADYRRHLVNQGYTRATIGVKLQAVARLYEAMVWRGLRPDNPAAGVKAPRDETAPEERIKFLPLDAIPRLLALCDRHTARGRRDRALVALMVLHGLRVAEVAGLELGDLEPGDPPALHVLGKRRKRRTVQFTPNTAAILAAWLDRRDLEAGDGTRALFLALDHRTHGGPMSARAIRRVIDGLLERAGLKRDGISCHSLRHTFATWATVAGAPLPAVSAGLGHSNLATTGIYARLADKIKHNPALYLEGLLDASVSDYDNYQTPKNGV
jgi:site-specific recombinase XerD